MSDKKIEMAVAAHMQQFVNRITDAMKDFIMPLDPSDGPEEMAYIRSVIKAIDNVVLVTLMQTENEPAKAMMDKATDVLIQNLIEHHNENAEKH